MYIFGEETKFISIEEGRLCYQKKEFSGLIQLAIICPQNLKNPFLLIRNKNKLSVAPNCFTCGFKSLQNAKINSCKHNFFERAIKGTYCVSEINFALKLGYEVLKIFSCLVFEKSEPILRDFISLIGFEKITSSKFDPSFNLKEISKNMFFSKQLSPESFKENVQKRNFSKLILNSFLGKFSQRSDRTINKIISNEEELSKYFYSKTVQISDIFAINQHFCQIQLKKRRKTLINPNLRTNCIVGAHVVSFAREFMHQKILDLEKINAKLFYIDTDSLIFTLKRDQEIPFKISPCFGDFKFEIPQNCKILSFFSLGPKNFAVKFENESGVTKDLIKLRGITLSNEINNKILDSKIYDFYLKQFLKSKKHKIEIPQVRSKLSKYKKIKLQKFQKVFFSNSIKSKRIINKQCKNLSSFPYGYCEI